jgi:hypothetical protein
MGKNIAPTNETATEQKRIKIKPYIQVNVDHTGGASLGLLLSGDGQLGGSSQRTLSIWAQEITISIRQLFSLH